jgi:hypothetical protein
MSVKLTDAQLAMMSAAAQHKDWFVGAGNDQGRGSQQSQRQAREAWFGLRDRGETWSVDLAPPDKVKSDLSPASTGRAAI